MCVYFANTGSSGSGFICGGKAWVWVCVCIWAPNNHGILLTGAGPGPKQVNISKNNGILLWGQAPAPNKLTPTQ